MVNQQEDYRKYKIKTVVYEGRWFHICRWFTWYRLWYLPIYYWRDKTGYVAKEVIQEQLGLDIPIAGLQKWQAPDSWELLLVILQVVELSRNSQEFFLLQRPRWGPPLRYYLPPPTRSKNSFIAFRWYWRLGPSKQILWNTSNLNQD